MTARLLTVLAGAVALAAALVVASQLSANDREATPTRVTTRAFEGIPQDRLALGSPDAPVTLVEYADLQCPYCAQWSRETLPVLVDEYVRAGKLRIVFHGLAFIGPDSVKALDAALGAAQEDRLWDVVDALFRSQGHENSGWVTDELLDEVAGDRADGTSAWVERAKVDAENAARSAGVTGTPSFQVGRTGGELRLVRLESIGPDGLRPAIESLLR